MLKVKGTYHIARDYQEFKLLWEKLYGKLSKTDLDRSIEAEIIQPIYTERELGLIEDLEPELQVIINDAKKVFNQGGVVSVKR